MNKIKLLNKKALTKISDLKVRFNDENSFFGPALIFMVGSVSVSVLSWLYQLLMGRMLGPNEYGILGALFALVYIATYATTAFNLSVSKFSAEFHGKEKIGEFKYLIRKSLMFVSVVGIICFIIYLFLIPYIANFLKIEDYFGIMIVGLIALLSIISAVLTGALNGSHKFVWQNVSSFCSALVKVGLAVILVYLGYSVGGALIGVFVGLIIGILISLYPFVVSFKNVKIQKFDSSKIPFYFMFVFLSSILPILIITFDQLLVKHYFSSTDAGFYVAAGMIAKIIWFGSGFLVSPLFPKVVSLHAKGKDTSRLLFKAILYTGFLISVGCAAYYVMPTFLVSTLFGSTYLPVVPLIGLFGVAMGLFSLIQIMITYNLALERKGFIPILIVGLIIELIGILLFHKSLEEIVKIVFATNCFIIISMIFYNRKELFKLN
ncbi:MAG TPA: oligosaccharide flippase family protein [Candidatus Paceibacterota bacterium]|nr:oligosaccharide flippase family protein [Candidatus Paceibacterota bacterium]